MSPTVRAVLQADEQEQDFLAHQPTKDERYRLWHTEDEEEESSAIRGRAKRDAKGSRREVTRIARRSHPRNR